MTSIDQIPTPVNQHCPHGYPLYYRRAPEADKDGKPYIQAYVGAQKQPPGRACATCPEKIGVPFYFGGYPEPKIPDDENTPAEKATTTDSEEESHQ